MSRFRDDRRRVAADRAWRLRDERFGRADEERAARERLEQARTAVRSLPYPEIRTLLGDSLSIVEDELAGTRRDSLAGRLERAVLTGGDNEAVRLTVAVVIAVVDLALGEEAA